MEFIDIVLGVILLFFMFMGFKNGFVKKIVSIACLGIGLILATKFSSDVAQLLFEPMGVSGKIGFILSFILIVVAITLIQALVYKFLLKDLVDGVWNKIGGVVIGLIEGGLILSIILIILSIYFHLPAEKTRASSELYKPIKNFAPMVFDGINTFLPESEDFYQQIFKSASEAIDKGGKQN